MALDPNGDGVWLNAVGTAVPAHDVHARFLAHAQTMLAPRDARLFTRMAARSGIEARRSALALDPDPERPDALDVDSFYPRGRYPDTGERMRAFERLALPLALEALADLDARLEPGWTSEVTHLFLTCCTGFAAPGLDAGIIDRLGLDPGVERTCIGFMGCNAAFNALKLARHVVRSDPEAKALVVSLELCTLHLQDTADLERVLSFLLFADGCGAALVSREPRGVALDGFASTMLGDGEELITWRIGASGFDMHLSGDVPALLSRRLPDQMRRLSGGRPVDEIGSWAIHPGGRSILDAVETALALDPRALGESRDVLRANGNMSSATILFVLKEMLARGAQGPGVAFGFGPGLSVEGLAYRVETAA